MKNLLFCVLITASAFSLMPEKVYKVKKAIYTIPKPHKPRIISRPAREEDLVLISPKPGSSLLYLNN